MAPEFIVGALANGIPRCFHVTAVSIDGFESGRSPLRADTPRPESRNVAVSAAPIRHVQSGFRFWDDLDADGSDRRQRARSRAGRRLDRHRFLRGPRRLDGRVFLTPVRFGTGVEYYQDAAGRRSHQHRLRRRPRLSHQRDRGAARVRIRLRDGWRRRLPAVRRASGVPRGSDVHHLRLGVPDRSGESRAAREKRRDYSIGSPDRQA